MQPFSSLKAAYGATVGHPCLTHTNLKHRLIPKRGYVTLTTMATADAGHPSTELEPPSLSLKLRDLRIKSVIESQIWRHP